MIDWGNSRVQGITAAIGVVVAVLSLMATLATPPSQPDGDKSVNATHYGTGDINIDARGKK